MNQSGSSVSTAHTKHRHQPRGFFHILVILMWEYFSYYGMRGLLVLYLTGPLLFSDAKAYDLYGDYTALVYVTPVLGGLIADKLLGYRASVVVGSFLMICGHVVLGFSGQSLWALYVAMAFIICGYGLFKTNISCLLGELYEHDDERRDAGFSLMYVGGNIGSILAALIVGWVAHYLGWHIGFTLAGIGMVCGLLIFLQGHRHFRHVKGINKKNMKKKHIGISAHAWLWIIFALSMLIVTIVLKNLWSEYVLTACGFVAIWFLYDIYKKTGPEDHNKLFEIILFMFFGLVYWVFNQQGGSSISLFIERIIDQTLFGWVVPTAMFQSVNPTALLLGGAAIAWIWEWLEERGVDPLPAFKLALGMMILTAGFTLLSLGAKFAATGDGHASMWWAVAGLALIGVSEIFVDPLAMAAITRLDIPGSTGTLAGIYMLVSGAIANFIAGWIAEYASIEQIEGVPQSLVTQAGIYFDTFSRITMIAGSMVVVLIIVAIATRKIHR